MKRLAISLLFLFSTLAFAGETVIYSFKGGSDGGGPVGGLISDRSGNLYGVTGYGGSGSCTNGVLTGCGTVFELSPNRQGGRTETVIYSFTGGADGQSPLAGLILDALGNLYGTTNGSGVSPRYGSAFELSPSTSRWTITVLHAFRGGKDGGYVQGGLVMDSAGRLYGTTAGFGPKGHGTTFQLSNGGNGWQLKNLHAFGGGSDGDEPMGLLVLAADGAIYGTTKFGGAGGGGVFYGLSLNAKGIWVERVLHSFEGGQDGGNPVYGLTADQRGKLYGVSPNKPEWGDVFRFSPSLKGTWTKATLYTFRPPRSNGPEDPSGPVTIDSSGNVYGVTSLGGPFPGVAGTVYELTPLQSGKWLETLVHYFVEPPDGTEPNGGLMFDGDGNLYGVTGSGGTGCGNGGCGTVFEITP